MGTYVYTTQTTKEMANQIKCADKLQLATERQMADDRAEWQPIESVVFHFYLRSLRKAKKQLIIKSTMLSFFYVSFARIKHSHVRIYFDQDDELSGYCHIRLYSYVSFYFGMEPSGGN